MIYRTQLRDGDAGVGDTICLMEKLTNAYITDPRILRLVRMLRKSTAVETMREIFNWVVTRLRYVSDPQSVELVRSAKHTILGTMPYGDCDDLSVALATLLRAAGIPCQFKTIAWRPGKPAFSHVYVVARVNGRIYPLDPTMGAKGFNNEINKIHREKIWNEPTCWIR